MTKKQSAGAKAPEAGENVLDLSYLSANAKRQEEGIEVDILKDDGKTPSGLKIRVAGPDSQRAQEAQEALADEMLAKEDIRSKVTAREATERGVRYLAKITLSWSPPVFSDGVEQFSFSEKDAAKFYKKYKHVRDQVDRAAGDKSRFTEG